MIYLIAGRPKSGKTYEAVKYHIIPAVQKGRKVITNVPLDVDHFCKILGEQVRDLIVIVKFEFTEFDGKAVDFYFSKSEHYQDPWRNEKNQGPLYVIDECHLCLPKGKTPIEVKNFYTLHGHYGIDILLMTQQPTQMDTDVMKLVEIVYRTIKRVAFGSQTTYTKKVQDGWRGEVLNVEKRSYEPSIFKYYKAHTQASKSVLEAAAADIKPIWSHWGFRGAAVCLVLFVIIICTQDVNFLKPPVPKTKPKIDGNNFQNDQLQKRQLENSSIKTGTSIATAQQLKPVSPQEIKPSEPEKPKPAEHPYSKIQLHVEGFTEFGPSGRPVKLINFSASQNGAFVFTLNSKDLILAGYDVQFFNECLVKVSWEKYSEYIVCDSAKVGLTVAGSSTASQAQQ